jgi:hypothetical protein
MSYDYYSNQFESIRFAKNANGIANGPNTNPIIAQNILFEPLLSAIK